MKRLPISKSLRFAVFSRDRFTCRYCGHSSDEVKLVIDHIIPVSKGGGNGEENLTTSCEACNSGKGVKPAVPNSDSELDRLRAQQELQEQRQLAEKARDLSEARKELGQEIINFWCEENGTKEVSMQVVRLLLSFVDRHGLERVLTWISIAAQARVYSDNARIRYLCGVRRNDLKESQP